MLLSVLSNLTSKIIPNAKFEYIENLELGDVTTNYILQNKIKNTEEIIELLINDPQINILIDKISIAGPGFINFEVKKEFLVKNLDSFLKIEKTKSNQSWLIEHTSPNPNKAMHLGHLRNNITGMAISNLLEEVGAKVTRDAVDNNRGIAIAKLIWGYLKFARKDNDETKTDILYWSTHKDEWQNPDDLNIRPDRFVDELYPKASQDFVEKDDTKLEVRNIALRWENEEKEVWDIWEYVLSLSYKGQQMTLARLGNHYDKVWHEHEHYKKGKELVELGLKKGIFVKSDKGTIITNLKKFKLPDTVVLKSDGTSLYITQDLALTKLKKEEFKADKIAWVIGPDQSLAMKQVFAVCDQLGIGKYNDFLHISFGYMSIKNQGKMSSRKGNVLYIDDLIDKAKEIIKQKISKDNIDDQEKDDLSETIALAAVKYSILKVGRNQDIAFDFDESLNFEGNSAPYIQYTYVRTQSVISKASAVNDKFEAEIINSEELDLLRFLLRFSDTVLLSAETLSPNLLCNYIYNLSKHFNEFYNKHKIVGSDNETLRLKITDNVGKVIKKGLDILGIQVPSKM